MAGFYEQRDQDGNLIGWQAKVRKKGYPTQSKVFRSLREAQEWATVIESEMVRGTWRDRTEADATTLADALNRYAREVSRLKKGAVQELSAIAKLQESSLATLFLGSIQGKHIASYRDSLLAEGYKPATIKRRLSILSHLFAIADKEWGIDGLVNPVPRVTIKTGHNARDRRLTMTEQERLLAAAAEYGGHLASVIRFAMERHPVCYGA